MVDDSVKQITVAKYLKEAVEDAKTVNSPEAVNLQMGPVLQHFASTFRELA